jgi:hypothetical protein
VQFIILQIQIDGNSNHQRRPSKVDILFQQVLNGLTLGGIYSLVALGLTLVYGILHLPNFAHGASHDCRHRPAAVPASQRFDEKEKHLGHLIHDSSECWSVFLSKNMGVRRSISSNSVI